MSKDNLSFNLDASGSEDAEYFIPNIGVNCLILGFDSRCVRLLLYKAKDANEWIIPGDFVLESENVDSAAARVVNFRTGLQDYYLKQFHFFGEWDRVCLKEKLKHKTDLSRHISLCYFALVKYYKVELHGRANEDVQWFDINKLPEIHPAHKNIVDTVLFTIRQHVGFLPLGYELLADKFTMPELRNIYEAFLGREIDRRNFQRKMLSIGYIKPLNEIRKDGAHKSPNLYSFDKKKYKEAEEKGLQIMSNNL